MITHRLRGLLGLQLVGATLCAGLLFKAYVAVYGLFPPYVHWVIPLSPDAPYLGFLLCIMIGMIFGSRRMQSMATKMHQLNWVEVAQLSTRQVFYVALMCFGFVFAFKEVGLSRLFMGTYLVLCWAMLLLVNKGMPRMISRYMFGRSHRLRTLFVGPSGTLVRLQDWLMSRQLLGLEPVGLLTTDAARPEADRLPVLGSVNDLEAILPTQAIAQVVLLEIPRTQAEGNRLMDLCQKQGCRLLIYSNTANFFRHPLVTVNEEGHQFYALQEEPLEDPFHRITKRAFDIVLSAPVVIFILPPLVVLVWLMQRLQAPGPIMFVQERTGHGQHFFRMFKFRSMYYAGRNAAAEAKQASKSDSRIYPFGAFLRRSSLDEIPQFLNVLLGEMSIVGPRPHLPTHDRLFADQMVAYRTRFFVKPGITGLAQCNGLRGEITDPDLLRRRIEMDLEYITEWSIWLDMKLLFQTPWVVFTSKGAY